MPYIDLTDLISKTDSPINVFEIYLHKPQTNANMIDLCLEPSIIESIESKFRNPKTTEYKSYHMNDKIYTYELHNDNQIVISKHKVCSKAIRRPRQTTDAIIIGYKIDKYPPYTFPCTDEIDYIASYTIKEFKINNRITVNIRTEEGHSSAYIEYKHSDHVELDKVNETLGRLLSKM